LFVFDWDSGDDRVVDFQKGKDAIDLSAFDVKFPALDDDRDGKLEDGEGNRTISVGFARQHRLCFDGGSVKIEGVSTVRADDLLFV
jgi:hypothetical protein